jgi:hypothetical protein
MNQAATLLIVVFVLAAFAGGVFYLSRYLFRRAVRSVISLFRKEGATSPSTATTPEKLGIVQAGYFDRAFKLRDYRPYALRLLGEANIIRRTEDGTLYLSEEELERSPVRRSVGIK